MTTNVKNDRELLELAAKAYGARRELMDNGEPFFIGEAKDHAWNPLDYDDDALRLAVKLEIGVMSKRERDPCERNCSIVVFDFAQQRLTERHNGDELAATRRAIVRAAAAIGEGVE